jgi:hypothetical protein
MASSRRTLLARRILVFLLMPSLAFGQVPPAAQETLNQLQDTPGLTINTAPGCCKPSIWDHLGVEQAHQHIHSTLEHLANLPLISSLLQTLQVGLQAAGLAESPAAAEGPAGGAPGADGAPPGGGGAAGDIAQKIAADKQAADAKVATLEYLGQQDCNAYPEIIPAILELLDDPIERVRYAALVALQRQCRELRCSTLTGTRIRYRLHDEQFIAHCRQCASCACQQQVIKRLSDLLLDETALGYPKENSPRVRSLAASIIERCLQVHPVETATEQGIKGVVPDPVPAPVPDPEAEKKSDSLGARFPNAPLLNVRRSGRGAPWWKRVLGNRSFPGRGQAGRNTRGPATVYRSQSPDAVFDPGPAADQFSETSTWSSLPSSASDAARASGASPGEEIPLPPMQSEHVGTPATDDFGANEWANPDSVVPDVEDQSSDAGSKSRLLREIVADAEETIRAIQAGPEGTSHAQFEAAVDKLCQARLQLALEGDQQEFDNLYNDAAALCQSSPNTTAAAIALDALIRCHGARAGRTSPAGQDALREYAKCLTYRITGFDSYPAATPDKLYEAARALIQIGGVDDGVRCLQRITEHCGDAAVAASAASLLSSVGYGTVTPAASTSAPERGGVVGGMQDFSGGDIKPAPSPTLPSSGARPLPSEAADVAMADADMLDQIATRSQDQLYELVSQSEVEARSTYSGRDGAAKQQFESALESLCEARLELALRGDQHQLAELRDDAAALCERDPNSAGAAIATSAFTRYYATRAGESSEEEHAALRQYSKCLIYEATSFDPQPQDLSQKLFDAAARLRRVGYDEDADECLARIVEYCADSPYARDAADLLAMRQPPPSEPRSAPVNEPVPPVGPGADPVVETTALTTEVDDRSMQADPSGTEPEIDRNWLYESVADAEQTIRATFADRHGASKAQFETAVALLCESRLQLALEGDEEQFAALYEDAETLCRESPDSAAAATAMDALAAYYEAFAGESTPEEREALRKYAGCLRFRIARIQSPTEESSHRLLHVAHALHRAGMDDDAAACFRMLAKRCPGTEAAAEAEAHLASLQAVAVSAQVASNSDPSEPARQVSAHDAPAARDSGGHASAAVAAEPASSSSPANTHSPEVIAAVTETTPREQAPVVEAGGELSPRAAETITPPSTAADSTTAGPEIQLLPDREVATATAILSAPPADESVAPPPLPIDESSGPAVAMVQPLEDPFTPAPLPEDLTELARKALESNEFAYLHLQEEDDIVEQYNNSIGIKLAPYSLHHIDSAKPGNIFRVRFSSVHNYHRPDRSEYFWSKIGGGGDGSPTSIPRAETGLDYQQILVYNETAPGPLGSAFTEYPIYLLDPEQNSNTAGPGDITIGMKAVLIDDENWTVTSLTKTYTPVGTARRGLGRGHLALEQGVAILWRFGRQTYLHSDLKFHYPIAANPDHGGEVLIGGIGFSRVLWSDPIAPPMGRSYALLLTGETVITSFLDGEVTNPVGPPSLMNRPMPAKGLFHDVTGGRGDAEMTSVMQNFGLRMVWTKRFSTGLSIGFPLAASHIYDYSGLFELQWVH